MMRARAEAIGLKQKCLQVGSPSSKIKWRHLVGYYDVTGRAAATQIGLKVESQGNLLVLKIEENSSQRCTAASVGRRLYRIRAR